MAVATDPRLDEVKKIAKGRGVEFFFAQFVDMYGRPKREAHSCSEHRRPRE